MVRMPRLSRVVLVAIIFASGTLVESASAQRVMIMNSDDGNGPVISHFSMPDMEGLSEPDFVRSDVPIFTESLLLSEAQTAAIQRQIEMYLELFENLRKEILKSPDGQPMVMPVVRAGRRLEGGAATGIVIAPPNPDDLPRINVDDLEDLPGLNMEIGVRIGGPGEEDEDGGEGEGVSVNLRPANGVELPEEVRKELEKRAQEIAEQIRAQIEERRANGEDGQAAAAAPLMNPQNMEEFQKRREEMEAAAKAFRKAKAELRQQFVAEAQTQLSPPQVERWPNLERALLREKALPKGRLAGERTDLFKAMKTVEVSSVNNAELAAKLQAYELDLDGALRQRENVLEEVGTKVDQAVQAREFDKALNTIERATAARVAVRSINERYLDSVCESLAADQSAALKSHVAKLAYPQVYRQTIADKTFAAANAIEGVSPETQARIKEIEQAYRIERADVDAKLKRTIDKHQPGEPRRPIEHMKAISSGADPREMRSLNEDNPIAEATAKRRELDERYIKMVKDLLTPEQADQLPKVNRRQAEPIIIRRSLSD